MFNASGREYVRKGFVCRVWLHRFEEGVVLPHERTLSGSKIDRLKLAIYSSAGVFFGLAGVMQLSRLRQGDPTVAIGTELDVIAAVVIGGGSLLGGEGSVFGSVVGALIMAFLRNGCQQMGWPNYIQEIIIGAIIVLAVALDRLRAGWAA